jgi:hypothetical protein
MTMSFHGMEQDRDLVREWKEKYHNIETLKENQRRYCEFGIEIYGQEVYDQ